MNDTPSVLFDTSVATENAGDEIIMEAVQRELRSASGDAFFVRIATHDYPGSTGRRWIRKSDLCIVGGTNLLSSHFFRYRQWKFSPWDAFLLRQKVVLMGVGWWQFQSEPDRLTRSIYRRILRSGPDTLHSVRDSYTEVKLKAMGISNVLNTGCPTMWRLVPEHCARIPASKGRRAVVTLTDYNKDPDADKNLLDRVSEAYEGFVVWPQGVGDLRYARDLGVENIASPGLGSLDQLLAEDRIDYIGTRLHAGVRALQFGRRTIVLAVDNRAREISKDTNLWVVDRESRSELARSIGATRRVEIRLPLDNIAAWKAWFARSRRGTGKIPE